MAANFCCEGTSRHATEHGYDVTFLSDAIGAENMAAYEAAVHLNYPLVGNAVLEVDELLAALDGGAGEARPQPGDTVLGSDRGKIGTVEEIVDRGPTEAGYMLVKRGVILERDTYIPIAKRAGTTVFVNVPRLLVSKMPWDEPSPIEDARPKLGPARLDVDKLYRSRDHPLPSRIDARRDAARPTR